MNRELIYLFVNEVNGMMFQEGISFSIRYKVKYELDTRKLSIEKTNSENFFSNEENINNINLIVGRNGSGKTSILNLLGSKLGEREKLLGSSGLNFWFAIYSTNTEEFIIEGKNIQMISNVVNLSSYDKGNSTDDFFIKTKYDYSSQKLELIQVVSNLEKMKLMYMYYNSDLDFPWFSSKFINDRSDLFEGYSRNYINSPNIKDIFKSLLNITSNHDNQFTAKNIEMRIDRRNITREKDYEDLYWKDKYTLYNNENLILLNKSNILLKNENFTINEYFTLTFLEECVLYKVYIDYDSTSKVDHFKAIRKLKLRSEEYEDRKEYLLNVLSELYNKKLNNSELVSGFKSLTKIFETLEEKFIITNQIIVNVRENIDNNVINELIDFYDEQEEYRDVFPLNIEFSNLSNGELQYLDHFSNLITTLDDVKKNLKVENLILLFDEPDANFHPEWSRQYINNLVSELKRNTSKDLKFQIIITTHSPFMISDLPRHCITCIDVVSDESGIRREMTQADFGLMSNFYDLIKNNFFIKHPVGEFASEFFNGIINSIKIIEDGLKNEDEGEKQKIFAQRIENIENSINWIDDKVIKNKLKLFLEETIEDSQFNIAKIKREVLIKKKNQLKLEIEKIETDLEFLND